MMRLSHAGNLIWIERDATPEFWDERWAGDTDTERKARGLFTLEYINVTRRFLPGPGARILEGGCGNGGVVLALSRAGYDVLGVDYAQKAVARINQEYPSLAVQFGDVRALHEIAGNSFDGYWSLGVIEHFWDGYGEIINEAHRVLKPGGYLFLTFPWMSPVRKLKVFLGMIKKTDASNGKPPGFYQFSLNAKAVIKDLREAGFDIISISPQAGFYGLKTEIPVFKRIWQSLSKSKTGPGRPRQAQVSDLKLSTQDKCKILLDRLIAFLFGHGVLIVAQKNKNPS